MQNRVMYWINARWRPRAKRCQGNSCPGENVTWRNPWIIGNLFKRGCRILFRGARVKGSVRCIFRFARDRVVVAMVVGWVLSIYLVVFINLILVGGGGSGLQHIYITKTFKLCIAFVTWLWKYGQAYQTSIFHLRLGKWCFDFALK